MQVFCTQCGQPIPTDDLNVQTAIAHCPACHAVFRFDEVLAMEVQPGEDPSQPHPEPAPLPLPANMYVEDRGDQVRYIHHWFTRDAVGMLIWALLWTGVAVLMWGGAILARQQSSCLAALATIIAIPGFWMGYAALCGVVNRTTVTIAGGALSIRHGPLPWPGDLSVDCADLRQLYCRRRYVRKRGDYYDLRAQLHRGRGIRLIANLRTPEPALYLEQEIERRLHIENRHVRGEYRG